MSVTIRDVAKRLNLSITTVSRALDGYPDVAEAPRHRVTQVACVNIALPGHPPYERWYGYDYCM